MFRKLDEDVACGSYTFWLLPLIFQAQMQALCRVASAANSYAAIEA